MRMPKMISSLSLSAALLFSAEAQESTLPRMELSTDKACYLPGEMVHLTAAGTPPSALFIRYRHGAQILAEVPYAEVVKGWSLVMAPSTAGLSGLPRRGLYALCRM